jgi:hypothetical protein
MLRARPRHLRRQVRVGPAVDSPGTLAYGAFSVTCTVFVFEATAPRLALMAMVTRSRLAVLGRRRPFLVRLSRTVPLVPPWTRMTRSRASVSLSLRRSRSRE